MSNHNGTIYLSGGMQYADAMGGKWRAEVSSWMEELGFIPLNITLMEELYNESIGHHHYAKPLIDASDRDNFLHRKMYMRHNYVHLDCKLLHFHTDALVVLYDESVRRGAGTISECQLAYDDGIPLFIVNSYDNINEVPEWMIALSTKIFPSFDELKTYLTFLPPGVLRQRVDFRSGHDKICVSSVSGEVLYPNTSSVSPIPDEQYHKQQEARLQSYLFYIDSKIS